MSKRGLQTISNAGSPMAKARPCLVAWPEEWGHLFTKFGISGQSGEYRWKKRSRNSRWKQLAIRFKIRNRVLSSESTFQWPLETAGGRINSKHTVMRENILTPIAQGDLRKLRQHQNFRKWNTRTINTWARSFSFCTRDGNVSKRRNILNANETNVLTWGMFMSSSTKPPFIFGRIAWRLWKSTRTRTSRRLKVCSTLLRSW